MELTGSHLTRCATMSPPRGETENCSLLRTLECVCSVERTGDGLHHVRKIDKERQPGNCGQSGRLLFCISQELAENISSYRIAVSVNVSRQISHHKLPV